MLECLFRCYSQPFDSYLLPLVGIVYQIRLAVEVSNAYFCLVEGMLGLSKRPRVSNGVDGIFRKKASLVGWPGKISSMAHRHQRK